MLGDPVLHTNSHHQIPPEFSDCTYPLASTSGITTVRKSEQNVWTADRRVPVVRPVRVLEPTKVFNLHACLNRNGTLGFSVCSQHSLLWPLTERDRFRICERIEPSGSYSTPNYRITKKRPGIGGKSGRKSGLEGEVESQPLAASFCCRV